MNERTYEITDDPERISQWEIAGDKVIRGKLEELEQMKAQLIGAQPAQKGRPFRRDPVTGLKLRPE